MQEKESGTADIGEVRFFNVKNCPHDTFARFHKYCEEVSKDAGLTYASYPLGIKALLDKVEPLGSEPESQDSGKEKIKRFGK